MKPTFEAGLNIAAGYGIRFTMKSAYFAAIIFLFNCNRFSIVPIFVAISLIAQ